MTSLEEILNKPSGEIKPPEALPVGTYHCIVDGVPAPGKSSQKQTDYFRFKFKIMAALDDVNKQAAAEQQVVGKFVNDDYYVTDAAAYRLKDFLVDHLGIDSDGDRKPLREMLAEAPNKQVLVKLAHKLSTDGKRVFHVVDSTANVKNST